ncbi:hypothetical protein BMF94_1575 [Rhodotorula taiwanensis]|uniref:Large ribosomal subunit protein uL23m n=1 Tax=Rhodotorula taiwanensis TaxID=741276 RepID=A0A2S5BF03_9BASI|nr:hypothetical protein BMF94_1575 [Rhodotorula taiwanensis]
MQRAVRSLLLAIPNACRTGATRSAAPRVTAAVASSSRSLATQVVDTPFDPPTTVTGAQGGRTAVDLAFPLADSKTVHLPRSTPSAPSSSGTGAKAPRYSRHSSRVKGRTPAKPPKAVAPGIEGATHGDVKVYLPSVFMRLVRNTAEYKDDPYTATFRTALQLTKPDIANYLKNVYGLEITSIRTMNYLSALKRNPIGGGKSRSGGTKNYKKVLVTMKEPFWFPEEKSRAWLNEHFERDRTEEMRDRKMLKIGDGNKYKVGSFRYRGARFASRRAELKLAATSSEKVDFDARAPGDEAAQKRATGLKRKRNVMRSREEQVVEQRSLLQREMDRLREAGW